jgi:opacity protein-like surface antigen
MRKYLLAGAGALAIAAPAAATTDNSPYVGIEGGIMFPKSQSVSGSVNFTDPTVPDIASEHVGSLKYKKGLDLDFIGGYDFGMFRLEGELGWKRAALKSVNVNNAFLSGINTPAGTTFDSTTSFGLNGHATVLSAMLNGLVDVGGNGGIGAYAGGGAGYADVKEFGSSSGKFAWQLIAGAYVPVGSNVDLGLKYRYFHAGRTNFDRDFPFVAGATTCGAVACTGGTASFGSGSRFTSHSLLASLVYNFGASAAMAAPPPPPPPPPAPPPAPATQTCPDGSVIAASDACPAPPPPPPPAPAPTERGERGR